MKTYTVYQPLSILALDEASARFQYEQLMTLNPTAQYNSKEVVVFEKAEKESQ